MVLVDLWSSLEKNTTFPSVLLGSLTVVEKPVDVKSSDPRGTSGVYVIQVDSLDGPQTFRHKGGLFLDGDPG